MNGLIPAPRTEWSEAEGRRQVTERASGFCEGCRRYGDPLEWSHRLSRSRGGGWQPWNGLHLCTFCHQWAHAQPGTALALGWHLETGADPTVVAAWLALPWRGWWRVHPSHDDGPHLLTWLDHEPQPLVLPPWVGVAA